MLVWAQHHYTIIIIIHARLAIKLWPDKKPSINIGILIKVVKYGSSKLKINYQLNSSGGAMLS